MVTGCLVGECKNDYGQFKWGNGDFFSGFFKDGKPHLGTYTFVNGDMYQWMFNLQWQFQGQGYYLDKNYLTKIGLWENGKLVISN